MILGKCPWALLALLVGAPAWGDGPALTLEDCQRLAEAAPSPVQVAERQRAIADARIGAATAGLLPRLFAVGGYTRNSPLAGSNPEVGSFVSLNGVNQYTALLALNEELDLSGRLRSMRARARADKEASEALYRISRRDLRYAVSTAYHHLLLARRLVQVADESFASAQQFAGRTQLLEKKGEAARADVVRASVEVQFLEQARQTARLEASLANEELAAFWTEDVATPLAVVDRLDEPAPPPPAERPEAARARPELSLLEAQRRGFEAEASAARAARLPQASVTAEYGLDANRASWHDRGYAVILGLVVPILDWSAAANTARVSALQADQTAIQAQAARRAYSRDYHGALERVRAFYQQITVARAQVELARENLQLSRVRYEGGEGTALEVVTAQTQQAQARSNYYQAVAGHLRARADLAIAGGQ
jgi:outer membrane protein